MADFLIGGVIAGVAYLIGYMMGRLDAVVRIESKLKGKQ